MNTGPIPNLKRFTKKRTAKFFPHPSRLKNQMSPANSKLAVPLEMLIWGQQIILRSCNLVWAFFDGIEQKPIAPAVRSGGADRFPKHLLHLSQGRFHSMQMHCRRITPFRAELLLISLIIIWFRVANLKWETRAETGRMVLLLINSQLAKARWLKTVE